MKYFICCAAVAILVLSGCQTNPFTKSPVEKPDSEAAEPAPSEPAPVAPASGLAMAPDQRFPDIPLPVGVKEDPDRTFVYQSSSLSLGRMAYTSKASVNELAQFYIQESPAADWQLENVIQADGAELTFKKPGKRLLVNVRDLGVTRGRMLTLTLTPSDGK